MSTALKANAELALGFASSSRPSCSKPNSIHTQLSTLPSGSLPNNFSGLSMASSSGISQSKRVCSLSKNDSGESSGQNGGFTYKDAGVDIDAGSNLFDELPRWLLGLEALEAFSLSVIIFLLLVLMHCVGTKLKLAFDTGIYETIGIDLVAMSVNDIVTSGAKPLFFLDCFATSRLDVDLAEKVIKGIVDGCQQSDCPLLGGETAEMPGFYAEGEFDLCGTAVGIGHKESVIDGKNIVAGDVLIGLPSSGVHSNGFSLVRRFLLKMLCAFCFCLLKQVLDIVSKGGVKGVAHITGGGFTDNIPRVFPKGLGAVIYNDSWEVPAVFKWIQEAGRVEDAEMRRTFNMGIGMVLVVSKEASHRILEDGNGAYCIGEVVTGEGVSYRQNV
ncbi:putative phosphoribosylformylglycinamidine cyclo-ligase [Rosa chinensis]|uniref:phosphoribosylformylglycinamidine cyclo-ligase n=1 Tax=Rosa chinensis TaxID=74649 RepID=A0A2P6PCA7_ROSCH|nr:putative phosphoribosylformylglycinamidine cyclo-ligase [Rosa chinensis]